MSGKAVQLTVTFSTDKIVSVPINLATPFTPTRLYSLFLLCTSWY